MKNLPYFGGGACKKQEIHLSFKGNLKELEFVSFEDFCKRADKILLTYIKYKNEIPLIGYKQYIYNKKLNENEKLNEAMKDKCFEWIMSSEYDEISMNDLYSLLGMEKKGKNK